MTDYQSPSFVHRELEFMAEWEIVSIIPRFNAQVLNFMGGSFGPFVAEVPIEVPLWIALNLKLKEKCSIICPHWLTANSLQNHIALERPSANDDEDTSTDIRSTLPYHYAEIGFLILHYAPDNVPDLDTVRDRLNELQTLRNTKIERIMFRALNRVKTESMLSFQEDFSNVGAMEVAKLRAGFIPALDKISDIYLQQMEVAERQERARRRQEMERRRALLEARRGAVAGALSTSAASPGTARATPGALDTSAATFDSPSSLFNFPDLASPGSSRNTPSAGGAAATPEQR